VLKEGPCFGPLAWCDKLGFTGRGSIGEVARMAPATRTPRTASPTIYAQWLERVDLLTPLSRQRARAEVHKAGCAGALIEARMGVQPGPQAPSGERACLRWRDHPPPVFASTTRGPRSELGQDRPPGLRALEREDGRWSFWIDARLRVCGGCTKKSRRARKHAPTREEEVSTGSERRGSEISSPVRRAFGSR
jgi:hypothetical protein